MSNPDENQIFVTSVPTSNTKRPNGGNAMPPRDSKIIFQADRSSVLSTRIEFATRRCRHCDPKFLLRCLKLAIFVGVWLACAIILISEKEEEHTSSMTSVPPNKRKVIILDEISNIPERLRLTLSGAFHSPNCLSQNGLDVWYSYGQPNASTNIISIKYRFPIIEQLSEMDTAPTRRRTHTFDWENDNINTNRADGVFMLAFESNLSIDIPVEYSIDTTVAGETSGIIWAGLVLIGMYTLIIFDIIHRTFAAVLASTCALAVLAARGDRPTMDVIIAWIDVETLLLLFSMMILVSFISQTGFFDYAAVFAYKITNGKLWPLINALCLLTALLAMFLDCVTTILMMTPVVIRICEVMLVNPVPVLTIMIIICNLSGIATPVGDPPNIMIVSNPYIANGGVTFLNFTAHMFIGIILIMAVIYCQLRYFHYKSPNSFVLDEPQEILDLRREIIIWQKAAENMLSACSRDEDIIKETLSRKIANLAMKLNHKIAFAETSSNEQYRHTLVELKSKFFIKDKVLLAKCALVMVLVIVLFLLHSFPGVQNLSFGWVALLGLMLLLILAEQTDIDHCLRQVEWSTLLFFAALFILIECLGELGLIHWLGRHTEQMIESVSDKYRLAVAIQMILWVSALLGAFIDNIPLASMMIKIVVRLAENERLSLPLHPMVFALAFGCGLGGNGTLIGASSNVVCAGVAELHGYRINFLQFFKVGFSVMIVSLVVTSIYLHLSHVVMSL